MFGVTKMAKTKNEKMAHEMQAFGYNNVAQLSRASGVSQASVHEFLNMEKSPFRENGDWRDPFLAIAEHFGVSPEDLVSEGEPNCGFENRRAAAYSKFYGSIESENEKATDPFYAQNEDEVRLLVREFLDDLNARQRDVVESLWGLGGARQMRRFEMAHKLGVSVDRIRQIEQKAARRMKDSGVKRGTMDQARSDSWEMEVAQ